MKRLRFLFSAMFVSMLVSMPAWAQYYGGYGDGAAWAGASGLAVPTLSQWGIILFATLALGFVVWRSRRDKESLGLSR